MLARIGGEVIAAKARMESTPVGYVPAIWVPASNTTIRLPALTDAMECARICDAITMHYANDAAGAVRA